VVLGGAIFEWLRGVTFRWLVTSKRRKYNNFESFYYHDNYKAFQWYTPISSQELNGKKVVRFLTLITKYDIDESLKKYYFEVKYQDFNQLLID
jgi:hypothetical protein